MKKELVPKVCPCCGSGCGFPVAVERERTGGMEYMPDDPVGEGASSRGDAALEIGGRQERLTIPLNGWAKTSEEEIDLIGDAKKKRGPASITASAARRKGWVKRGAVFMPFPFPGTNMLTQDITDLEAMMPELNSSAAKISRRD